METSLEPFPPVIEPSDDFPPQPAERSAYFPAAVSAAQEHKDEARRAPARRNVAAKTGASGPNPKIPGALDFPGVFCL